ncbi:MAG: hypothetical protein QOI58_1247 [Thermoanaerobaculia bacterium]|jgi:SAM-dependent methyltransferase|nr:hypothetical protein [Thermoanaerobaculia bacterium]
MSSAAEIISRRVARVITFACASCGLAADAPPGTNRHNRKLCRACFGKRSDKRPRELNELSGAEWARASKSVEVYPDVRSAKQRLHGASFPQSLAEEHIKIFTRSGDVVLDPFVGVGTTLDAATALGRYGIGIDISQRFLEMATASLHEKGTKTDAYELHCGDARSANVLVPPNSVDLLLTSPPYSTLLQTVKGKFAYKWREHSKLSPVENPRPYSGAPNDLGNMSYMDYLASITDVFTSTSTALKSRAYSVWVVKDFRDLPGGTPYVDLHSDIIRCAEAARFQLWDIRIFDQTRHRPLVCLGFPSKNFYLNIGHSYILIFRKAA